MCGNKQKENWAVMKPCFPLCSFLQFMWIKWVLVEKLWYCHYGNCLSFTTAGLFKTGRHIHTHSNIFHCRVTVHWVSQKTLCLEHWSVAVKGLAQRHAFGSDVRRYGWNASLSPSAGLHPASALPWGRGWLDHWPPQWWSAFNCTHDGASWTCK